MSIAQRGYRIPPAFNPAAPGPIGSGTPGAITGTTITATEQFLAPDGTVSAPGYAFAGDPGMGFINISNFQIGFVESNTVFEAHNRFGGTRANSVALAWMSGASATSGQQDVRLERFGAGILGQYDLSNGSASQYQIYATRTDASNYERLALKTTAGSKVTLAAETAGTGADNLDLELVPAGTGVVQFSNPQDGAGAASGTLTNAPSAGNPSDWIKVKIGANVRYIPAWA